MPQQDLHGAQVGADLEQVRGERVTKEMRIDAEREARALDRRARPRMAPGRKIGTAEEQLEDHEELTGVWNDASAAMVEYLASKGQSAESALGFNRWLQVREAVLEEGECVAVLATVMLELDPEPSAAGEGYRDRPKRKVLVTPPGGVMLLSDAPAATT